MSQLLREDGAGRVSTRGVPATLAADDTVGSMRIVASVALEEPDDGTFLHC